MIIPHQVRLSLRKELLRLVLGTSLNHRPTLRVVHASLSRFLPLSLVSSSFGKARSLMCSMEVNKIFRFEKWNTIPAGCVRNRKKVFLLSLPFPVHAQCLVLFFSSNAILHFVCATGAALAKRRCLCCHLRMRSLARIEATAELMYVQLSYLPVPSVALLTQYMAL